MPLEVAVQGSTGPPVTLHSIVLSDRSAELTLVLDIERGEYVELNPGFDSYYRSDYSRELSLALEASLASCSLRPVDRLSCLEDRVSLVLAKQGNTSALLTLIGL